MFSLQNYTRDHNSQEDFGLIPDEAQIKRIQEISLEMYKDVLGLCQQNNITIMLGGGSVLGAIRHNGYIPWDDDIDLMIPRSDYNKFLSLFNKHLAHKYGLKYPGQNDENSSPFPQVVNLHTKKVEMFHNPKKAAEGIHMDIFILDYAPQDRLKYYFKGCIANTLLFLIGSKIIYQGQTYLSKQFFCKTLSSRIFYNIRIIIGFCTGLISAKKLDYYFDRFIASDKETELITIPSGRKHYFGETLPADVFFPARQVPFEDTIAYVPNNFDRYLRNLYGDNYMEIPPIEKRENHPYVKLELE